MAKKTNLLDLSTTGEIERKTFKVDGTPYEIRDKDELTLDQQQQLNYAGTFLKKYFEEEANTVQHEKAKQMLHDCIGLICVKFPAKVRDQLSDNSKYKIFHAFGEANESDGEAKKK